MCNKRAYLLKLVLMSEAKIIREEGGTGGKSPFSLLSEPISPSSLLFESISPFSLLSEPISPSLYFLSQFLPPPLNGYFSFSPSSLLFPPYFSLLPTLFGPFLPPPYSVPPPSLDLLDWSSFGGRELVKNWLNK